MRRRVIPLTLLLAACLDPLTSDEIGNDGVILPPGSDVASAHADPIVESAIAESDGVSGLVRRINGFARGAPIAYWDFGASPTFAAPLFVLRERSADGDLIDVDHPNVVGVIPGDPGYSPFWAVIVVEVTDAYDGEILPSIEAIQRAESMGLVNPREPLDFAVNCPIVARDVRLELDGAEPLAADNEFFYDGRRVDYYDFGRMALLGDLTNTAESIRLSIRREGQDLLSEVVRNVDLTGDGDTDDTNDIFDSTPADGDDYAPLARTLTVTVDQSSSFGLYRSIDDLFTRGSNGELIPRASEVLGFDIGDTLSNLPQDPP